MGQFTIGFTPIFHDFSDIHSHIPGRFAMPWPPVETAASEASNNADATANLMLLRAARAAKVPLWKPLRKCHDNGWFHVV